ncbi:NADH:ubiquinone reductase (Na(+)-transporting) subunit C [Flammeovirga pectinis]|uniref:Na(+)-translocating NADH-quinone reductase subunit C n=1 Tax=Flammeovirga pectinis TaxID=2494373 RepID=A0A3S9P350_9BACT|nr:NADH:ubiquinone reductase (Na(+)-transporting) subunit C [Flammeovirga pectinis]AZQ62625.1 NADH:ubiquinone reductase (Na(+)-transporting) subunit C [Flammeovirga pectinis]
MQQSNGYVIGFAVAMTIILGGVLSFTAVSLNAKQKEEVALDTKKQIMLSVLPEMSEASKAEMATIYDKRISVVNSAGEAITPDNLAKLDISKEWKKLKNGQDAVLPVYKFMSEDGKSVDSYILPMYGYGLWNDIWGYFALDADLVTVKGVVFSHKGETPGLGARIGDAQIQDRYKGKKIFNGGKFTPIVMVKGEGHSGLPTDEVDGMSGATLTANGLNEMVSRYLKAYEPFINKEKGTSAVSMAQ